MRQLATGLLFFFGAVLTVRGEDAGSKDSVADIIAKINERNDLHLLEGDIAVGNDKEGSSEKRNAVVNKKMLWNYLFYEFHRDVSAEYRKVINEAIDEFNKQNCLRFFEYQPQYGSLRRLYFISGKGCWSYIGKRGAYGRQDLSIGPGCGSVGIVMHELMHAIGFYHEHTRPDRDNYVTIHYENIQKGHQGSFRKVSASENTTLNQPYDYDGLMHYGMYTYSKNGKKTIVPKDKNVRKLGQLNGFSKLDSKKFLTLYKCRGPYAWTIWFPYSPCNDSCIKTKKRYCHPDVRARCPGYEKTVNGVLSVTKKCSPMECRRHGKWGPWQPWGLCSKTCLRGVHSRKRKCDNPAPRSGGAPCYGIGVEVKSCLRGPCKVGPDDTTFEQGMGIWSIAGSLKRHKGQTTSPYSGPNGDHTYAGEGYYVYFDVSRVRYAEKATLKSKVLPAGAKCLTFWYYMYVAQTESLTLSINSEMVPIWSRKGSQGKAWKQAKVDLVRKTKFTIQFNFAARSRYHGEIALDDIFFVMGSCNPAIPVPENFECSFDDHCGFRLSNWSLVESGNQVDHTNEKGSYLASNGSSSVLTIPKALGDGLDRCITFHYILGIKGSLDVSINDAKGMKTVTYSVAQERNNGWKQGQFTLPGRKDEAEVIFEAKGKVLMDDLLISKGSCSTSDSYASPSVLNCGFERSICAWVQSSWNGSKWTIKKGTGNSVSDTDRCLYIEHAYPQIRWSKAILRSPILISASPYCLTLKISYYGSVTSALNIFLINAKGEETKIYQWKRGMQYKWDIAAIDLPINEAYQLEIVGFLGRDYKGDIAIDEIRSRPGNCADVLKKGKKETTSR